MSRYRSTLRQSPPWSHRWNEGAEDLQVPFRDVERKYTLESDTLWLHDLVAVQLTSLYASVFIWRIEILPASVRLSSGCESWLLKNGYSPYCGKFQRLAAQGLWGGSDQQNRQRPSLFCLDGFRLSHLTPQDGCQNSNHHVYIPVAAIGLPSKSKGKRKKGTKMVPEDYFVRTLLMSRI